MKQETIIQAAGETWNVADPLERCRKQKYIWARAFIVRTLRDKGMTFERIGEAVRLDHATALYLNAKMTDALNMPQAYEDILTKYEDYKIKLKEYDLQQRTNGRPRALRKVFHHFGKSQVVFLPGSRCLAPYPSNLHTSNRKPLAAQRNVRALHVHPHAKCG